MWEGRPGSGQVGLIDQDWHRESSLEEGTLAGDIQLVKYIE